MVFTVIDGFGGAGLEDFGKRLRVWVLGRRFLLLYGSYKIVILEFSHCSHLGGVVNDSTVFSHEFSSPSSLLPQLMNRSQLSALRSHPTYSLFDALN